MRRRRFLSLLGGAAALAGSRSLNGAEPGTITLPFENGERPLVAYPQKRPLIRLTTRPPQLETPFTVFNEGAITPNDAFFVRYHLAPAPPPMSALGEDAFRLEVKGRVKAGLSLSIKELRSTFEPAEVIAVNQCSGNSRGFFKPRVQGGQLGNGAMGNARWKGVRLKDLLQKAGVDATARQVLLNALDKPLLPGIPDFVKAIEIDQALDGECLLAYEMNGEPLPWLNGFPLRLVVPGHYGTYWVKHMNEITVVDQTFTGFWMSPGYRIPDDGCAFVEPGATPKKTTPITRFNVRSFITSHADGASIPARSDTELKGIAFDGGFGIQEVVLSLDGGRHWESATLGKDLGKYSYREWTARIKPSGPGPLQVKVRATNRIGQSQPLEPLWNPAGYMRNVVETVQLAAV